MAHTYSILPLSVPTLIQELVQKCSDNLYDELGLTVKFKHGTWYEIEKQILDDTKTTLVKNDVTPLVCLIHRIPEKVNASNVNEATMDILILNQSGVNKTIEGRELNIKTICYPIYAELLTLFASSRYIRFNGISPQHTKVDIYHLGQDTAMGNQKYLLPLPLDGVLLDGLQLDIYNDMKMCVKNTCSDTLCPNGRMIEILDVIGRVELRLQDPWILRVYLSDCTYTDNSEDPNTASYRFTDGNGNDTMMDVDTSVDIDVSSFADGVYIGSITSSNGAQISFEYTVDHAVIVSFTDVITVNVVNVFDCPSYPNYTSLMTASVGCDSTTLANRRFENGDTVVDGSIVVSTSAVLSGANTFLISNDSSILSFVVQTSSLSELNQKYVVKLKCNS